MKIFFKVTFFSSYLYYAVFTNFMPSKIRRAGLHHPVANTSFRPCKSAYRNTRNFPLCNVPICVTEYVPFEHYTVLYVFVEMLIGKY